MAATIQVVLQQDVSNVGNLGDLVRVRPGYARNFLMPRQLAIPATTGAVNRINHEKAVALAKSEKLRAGAREIADKIGGITLVIAHRVGEDGKLFGTVTTKEIEAVAKAKGFDIDRRKMHLAEPIRHIGIFEIPVKLVHDVTATLKVEVVAK